MPTPATQPHANPTNIQTRNGVLFDIARPRARDVDFKALAEALAKICRFGGHTETHYSVAAHSLNMAAAASWAARPYVLLHDAHEAFIGDIPAPAKAALKQLKLPHGFDFLVSQIDKAVHKAARLKWPVPVKIAREVKALDMRALYGERAEFLTPGVTWPLDGKIDPLPVLNRTRGWPDIADDFYRALCETGIVQDVQQ